MTYTGKCFGGPMHGQRVTHYRNMLVAVKQPDLWSIGKPGENDVKIFGPAMETTSYHYEQIHVPRGFPATVGVWIHVENGWTEFRKAIS